MNDNDLETKKLEIMRVLSTFPEGKSTKEHLQVKCHSLYYGREVFNKVLDLLVKERLVRIIPYDVRRKQSDVYELREEAKTKYGIDVSYESYYKPRDPKLLISLIVRE